MPGNTVYFAIALIAAKPVKPCDGGVFGGLNLLLKKEQHAPGQGRGRMRPAILFFFMNQAPRRNQETSAMNHAIWPLLALAAGAYLLGSLSFAVIVSHLMGLADPRSYGSGNPGATNVLRSGSKKAAAATLLLDAFKGWLPVALIGWLGAGLGLPPAAAAVAGLAAFLGHLYPVFFGFRGGKGVATAAGVILGWQPLLGLAVLLVWMAVALLTRYSSLAALTAAVLAPALYWAGDGRLWPVNAAVLAALSLMGLLLLWRHRENIRRLLAGTESRIGRKK